MSKNRFFMYTEYIHFLTGMTDEDQALLFRVILEYEGGLEVEEMSPAVKAVFSMIKNRLDNNREEYEKTCEIRAENGRKGGLAKSGKSKQTVANGSKSKQSVANCSKPKQNVADNDNDNDKEKEINNISLGHSDERPSDEEALFEELWKKCPNKRGKADVSKSQKKKLLKIGRDKMLLCLEKYSAEMRGREPKFIPHASRFFNKLYIDYLTEDAPELKPPDNAPFVETIPDDEVFPWEKYDE